MSERVRSAGKDELAGIELVTVQISDTGTDKAINSWRVLD
jgi:hypothetical protein